MNKTYVFHSDAGHGWLAVKRTELKALDILGKISTYSYQKGGTVYLEEDGDYSIFVNAKRAIEQQVEIRDSYRDTSPIRNYMHFVPMESVL